MDTTPSNRANTSSDNGQLEIVDRNSSGVSSAEIEEIVNCSSQDENAYPAIGLLNSSGSWRTDTWVDKATLTIKTRKEVYVQGFKITSDGAAFVEIYVSRSNENESADGKQKYRLLLSRSSLMTPLQSSPKKFESFRSKEREFDYEQLHEETRTHKWDLFKFVCSQTFNKDVNYGLRSINIITQDETRLLSTKTPTPSLDLGQFRIRQRHDTSKDLRVGSFFAKRQREDLRPSLSCHDDNSTETGIPPKRPATTVNNLMNNDCILDQNNTTKIGDKNITNNNNSTSIRLDDGTEKVKPVADLLYPRTNDDSNGTDTHESIVCEVRPINYDTSDTSRDACWGGQTSGISNHASNTSVRTRRKAYPKSLPYERILAGVVFVLSGYVNPERSRLRDLAQAMGASYEREWNSRCTHLICAFKNTPKYKEVISLGGRIMREHWIADCSGEKKLLDWRPYKLGNYSYLDSEEEDDSTSDCT